MVVQKEGERDGEIFGGCKVAVLAKMAPRDRECARRERDWMFSEKLSPRKSMLSNFSKQSNASRVQNIGTYKEHQN